jgi:NADH-quinone oxidoreductase subunit J
MLIEALFYVFGAILIAAALAVITARNPVYSALALVMCFISSAAIWLLLEAEFLAVVLVLVYVGAVMVLFLFVVMMLDVDFAELRQGFLNYMPVGVIVAGIFFAELIFVVAAWAIGPGIPKAITAPIPPAEVTSNTEALGLVLYTNYVYFFQLAGVVLLVAMIGAIVLTLRHKPNVKRQNIADQVARGREVELKSVRPGQGI